MLTSRNSIRNNAPWGLNRISSQQKPVGQNDRSLNFTYTFDSTAGAGSTVFIVGRHKSLVSGYSHPHDSHSQTLVSSPSTPNLKVVPGSEPPCELFIDSFDQLKRRLTSLSKRRIAGK